MIVKIAIISYYYLMIRSFSLGVFPVSILVCALTLAFYIFFSDSGYRNLKNLQFAIQKHQNQNKTMHQHVSKLKSEVVRLKRDKSYIEKHIRENLAYAKEDELVFLFKD